jgi:hypothetical protein
MRPTSSSIGSNDSTDTCTSMIGFAPRPAIDVDPM